MFFGIDILQAWHSSKALLHPNSANDLYSKNPVNFLFGYFFLQTKVKRVKKALIPLAFIFLQQFMKNGSYKFFRPKILVGLDVMQDEREGNAYLVSTWVIDVIFPIPGCMSAQFANMLTLRNMFGNLRCKVRFKFGPIPRVERPIRKFMLAIQPTD